MAIEFFFSIVLEIVIFLMCARKTWNLFKILFFSYSIIFSLRTFKFGAPANLSFLCNGLFVSCRNNSERKSVNFEIFKLSFLIMSEVVDIFHLTLSKIQNNFMLKYFFHCLKKMFIQMWQKVSTNVIWSSIVLTWILYTTIIS